MSNLDLTLCIYKRELLISHSPTCSSLSLPHSSELRHLISKTSSQSPQIMHIPSLFPSSTYQQVLLEVSLEYIPNLCVLSTALVLPKSQTPLFFASMISSRLVIDSFLLLLLYNSFPLVKAKWFLNSWLILLLSTSCSPPSHVEIMPKFCCRIYKFYWPRLTHFWFFFPSPTTFPLKDSLDTA